MKSITCNIPDSLYEALQERMESDKASCDHVVSVALSQCLGKPIHTLFQVSTSAALVEGLYQGAVRVSRLLRHGDFGLGTFIDLDGEMVVLDGICYQVSSSGAVGTVAGDRLIPYAVVTRFNAEFSKLSANLIAAASGQEEFLFEEVEGTLVGLWSPGFAGSFSVPGYHFHFLSTDRQRGGHVLECKALDVSIEGCAMNEMHVSLPETEEFLKADLTRDPQDDLVSAERNHES